MSAIAGSVVEGRAALRFELALTAGDDDVYGWCTGWWFPIAEIIYAIDPDLLPTEWRFRPSPSLELYGLDHLEDDPDCQTARLLDMLDDGEITVDDLLYWGRALTRYGILCRVAGRAY
jgi:hypothetical protein